MIVERIDLMIVRLELIRPFATSSSQKNHLEHILVKAYGEGLVGWGECASPSAPYYCEETTGTCWHILHDFLAPAVLGEEWSSIDELLELYRRVKGNAFARAGIEMACWDLLAQSRQVPLHRLLQQVSLVASRDPETAHNPILSGVSLGIEEDNSRLFDLIDRYLAEGYRRIKLKIGPGRDVDVVQAVRERYPDIPLMADANSAYTLADIPLLKQLDPLGLTMIEQPLAHDDIVDHARLQALMDTPICLDESIRSAADCRKAIEMGSCRVINIKVSRLGGLREAVRAHDVCARKGVPVWCGGMHEFGIGRAANVALCSLPGFIVPGDVSGSDKYYGRDIVAPPIHAINGGIALPDTPGLGYAVNEDRVKSGLVRTVTLGC